MNKLSKCLFLLCICALASLLLTGCQSAEKEKSQEKDGEEKLIEAGLEAAGRLKEWTCNEISNLMFGYSRTEIATEIFETVEKQDVSVAKVIYEVDIDYWTLFNQLYNVDQSESMPNLTDSVKKRIADRMYTGLSSIVNARFGIQELMFSSMYSDQRSFLYRTLAENRIYVYIFESGYPLYVAFIAEEDDIVTAYAQWLMMDCESITSEEALKQALDLDGIIVKKIK